jgi:hypothetical protein
VTEPERVAVSHQRPGYMRANRPEYIIVSTWLRGVATINKHSMPSSLDKQSVRSMADSAGPSIKSMFWAHDLESLWLQSQYARAAAGLQLMAVPHSCRNVCVHLLMHVHAHTATGTWGT